MRSEEECTATAMLLGGTYGHVSHTIKYPNDVRPEAMTYLDADTMQEITREEWHLRYKEAYRKAKREEIARLKSGKVEW